MTPRPIRALAVSSRWTWTSGYPARPWVPTPDDALTGGIVPFLARLAPRFEGEGVVILSADAAAKLGFPDELPDVADDDGGQEELPVLADARAAGWKVSAVRNWTTFYGRHREGIADVHVGLAHFIDVEDCPLWSPTSMAETVGAFGLWHDLCGSSYTMTPGVAATRVLQGRFPQSGQPGKRVTWKARVPAASVASAADGPWKPGMWRREHDMAWEHGYDANMAGLAAIINTRASRYPLKSTGRHPNIPEHVGWIEAELAPWQHPELPHPAGPVAARLIASGKSTVWITTARAELLLKLADDGEYGGIVSIWDSYTAPGSRLFRTFGEFMRSAYVAAGDAAREVDRDGAATQRASDAEAVAYAIKQGAAREVHGLMNTGRGSVQRSDWYHLIESTKQANQWRKMWRIATEEKRYPVELDDDKFWYPSDEPDGVKAAPESLKLSMETRPILGHYKHDPETDTRSNSKEGSANE